MKGVTVNERGCGILRIYAQDITNKPLHLTALIEVVIMKTGVTRSALTLFVRFCSTFCFTHALFFLISLSIFKRISRVILISASASCASVVSMAKYVAISVKVIFASSKGIMFFH